MARKKLSKGEMTKAVRRTMLKHQVHMSKLFFSASISSIYLSGELLRNDGKEFKHPVVQLITDELLQLGNIRCELENWIIGSDGIYYTGSDDKKAS